MSQAGLLVASGSGGAVNQVTGTNGVTASPTTGNVVVSGVNATTSTVGVASFNPAQFTVSGGAVSLIMSGSGIQTINTIAPDGSGNFSILGTANQVAITGGTNSDTISLIGPYTPSTYTANGILFGNTTSSIQATTSVNNGIVTTGATGTPVITALASDGQLIIGSSSGAPAAANLTAGANITITNSANSITIAASATAVTWTDKSTSFNAAKSNGYFVTATCTATLPASPSQGDTIYFIIDSASGILTITANTGQTIQIGTAKSASAGTAASQKNGDTLTLIYRSSDTNWMGLADGTWTVT